MRPYRRRTRLWRLHQKIDQCLQCVGDCLASTLGLEGVLMRGLQPSELLGNGSSNESPKNVPYNNTPDSPVRLLESNDPPTLWRPSPLQASRFVPTEMRRGSMLPRLHAPPTEGERGHARRTRRTPRRALRTFAKKRSCAKMNSSTSANWDMSLQRF